MAKSKGAFFRLEGLPALERQLNELQNNLRKKALRRATRESAKVVLAYAREMVPTGTGALKKSLKVRTKQKRGGTRTKDIGHSVRTGSGFFVGQEFYGGFVEYGTKQRKTKSGSRRGRMPPRPFLRQAAIRAKPHAISIFNRELRMAVTDLATTGKLQKTTRSKIKVLL